MRKFPPSIHWQSPDLMRVVVGDNVPNRCCECVWGQFSKYLAGQRMRLFICWSLMATKIGMMDLATPQIIDLRYLNRRLIEIMSIPWVE